MRRFNVCDNTSNGNDTIILPSSFITLRSISGLSTTSLYPNFSKKLLTTYLNFLLEAIIEGKLSPLGGYKNDSSLCLKLIESSSMDDDSYINVFNCGIISFLTN